MVPTFNGSIEGSHWYLGENIRFHAEGGRVVRANTGAIGPRVRRPMPVSVEKMLSLDVMSYILVPFGVMLISWGIQSHFRMRLNAGGELFAFGFALDLKMLMLQGTMVPRVNPLFQHSYPSVFGLALLVSLLMLVYACTVQSEIIGKQKAKGFYPIVKVGVCWTFGVTVISFHLFALLGS